MHWLKKVSSHPRLRLAIETGRSIWHITRDLFPFTWISIVLAALIYVVWFSEVSSHANQILYTAVLLWVFAFVLLFVFTLISTLLTFAMTHKANKSGTLEGKNETDGHLSSDWKLYVPFYMPFITVDAELLDKSIVRHAKRELCWETEWLQPTERGRHQMLRRKITVRDIFGLTSISFVMKQPVSLEIQPASGHFEMVSLKTNASGEGISHPEGDPRGELIEMRRYQAGDPLRLVIWKVFARSHKLVVRAPEPAIVEENDMFVYFVAGSDDENSASMARSFLDTYSGSRFSGEKRDMYFSADGSCRIASTQNEGLEAVVDSVSHRDRGGKDLMNVAPLVNPSAMSHCFLLVPSYPGKWLDEIKNFITQYKIQPIFILSLKGEIQSKAAAKPSRLKKLFIKNDQVEDKNEAFHSLCEDLSHLGTVRIVDVKTGAAVDFKGGAQ